MDDVTYFVQCKACEEEVLWIWTVTGMCEDCTYRIEYAEED